jgi:hypothetical protein
MDEQPTRSDPARVDVASTTEELLRKVRAVARHIEERVRRAMGEPGAQPAPSPLAESEGE